MVTVTELNRAPNITVNAIDAASVSASEQVGNATYATVGDVPTTLPEGAQVYVQDKDRIYVEDGT